MKISVCMGSSCFTRGNNDVLPVLQEQIAHEPQLGGCQLVGRLCAAECQDGPIVEVGGVVHPRMDSTAALFLLEWCSQR